MGNITVQQLKQLTEIIEQSYDTDTMMQGIVRAVKNVFKVDKAWLLYPCSPDTPSCRLSFSSCSEGTECYMELDKVIVTDSDLQAHLQELLSEEKPHAHQGVHCRICRYLCSGKVDTCSQLSIVLKMKNDRPWLFGLCNCSGRYWSLTDRNIFQLTAERLRYAYDTVRFMETVHRDIAKRQKIEAEILRGEQRFRSLFQHTSISLWMLDISRFMEEAGRGAIDFPSSAAASADIDFLEMIKKCVRVVDVNSVTLTLFAAYDKELLLSSLHKIITETSLSSCKEVFRALLSGTTHFTIETDLFTLLGEEVVAILNVDVLPVPDSHIVMVSVTDITARKKAEEKLFDSKEQYRLLMENASDAILLFDAAAETILEANPKAAELTGKSIEQLIGLRHDELHPPEDRALQRKLFRNHVRGRADENESSITILHQNGKHIPVQISASRTTIKGRTIVQRIYHNISTQVEEEEQRRLLFTAVEQAAECVVITDPAGIIEYVNPAYERITGYSKQEVIGKKPSLLKSGMMPDYHYRLLWQEITSGRVWRGKIVNKKKDGTAFTEDVTIAPVKDRKGNISHFVAVKRDITRQDQLERVVRQSQKMQAIGTLAGGIAHDFNNILTAILGFAELSLLLSDGNSLLKSNLSEIITASERAGNLIDRILTFSRQTEKNVSSLKLTYIVKEVLKLLRASLPANIEIITDIQTGDMVRADPTQIHQVVMNLCMNAYQALDGPNSWIKITLGRSRLSPHEGVNLGNLPAGDYVTLSVEDNGRGIADEHINRIFEPYFTTKEKNEGTGLGLSVVHGIINDHGGAITVKSNPGKGSCFTVYLPKTMEGEQEITFEEMEFITGEGNVLLVDDEQQIVDYEVQALEKAGYVTYAATSSMEALNMFNKLQRKLDLVITDMAMPQMTGLQLFQEIRKVRKDIPVLLCTGYSEHVSAESAMEMGIEGYLAKPFTAEQLAAEVSRILTAK